MQRENSSFSRVWKICRCLQNYPSNSYSLSQSCCSTKCSHRRRERVRAARSSRDNEKEKRYWFLDVYCPDYHGAYVTAKRHSSSHKGKGLTQVYHTCYFIISGRELGRKKEKEKKFRLDSNDLGFICASVRNVWYNWSGWYRHIAIWTSTKKCPLADSCCCCCCF